MDHGFLVDLVATLLHKIKQFLQVHRPRIKDVIAVLCCLETDYTHGPVDFSNQGLGHNHIREMLLSFLRQNKLVKFHWQIE